MSHIDNILIQVRAELNRNNVKLWLEPYYVEDIGTIESEMESLARNITQVLNIRYDYCLAALNELQTSALEKLQARKEFQESGIATVKVRTVRQTNGTNLLTLKIPLTSRGSELQQKVGDELKIGHACVKLISAGKVVDSEKSLADQGITNNQQLMAVILENSSDNASEMEMLDRVNKTKADAALLANCERESFMQLEDQDGNIIHMPPNEKKSLTLALALHEKGRAVLNREKYNEALILFLEADREFAACNANILETVDNYALLNLDIVWCYLCLKSLTQLPDAERRLCVCEENFRRTYGDNMDRVRTLKGNAENEKALIMRLHLLQAVLMFHQNRRNEAKGLLMLAEAELRGLKVDETNVALLIDMGYRAAESRVALRACGGDVERAVTHIIEKRETKEQARKRGKEELNLNKHMVGNDNDWVNPRSLNTLIGMGFQKDLAVVALKKGNNDVQVAIDMLQHNADALAAEASNHVSANEDLIEEIVNIGFPPELVRLALEQATNNSEKAIEILLKMQGDGTYDEMLTALLDNMPSTSTEARQRQEKVVKKLKAASTSFKETMEAYNRFSEDVSNEDEEYLNLSLAREEVILLEYKRFLE